MCLTLLRSRAFSDFAPSDLLGNGLCALAPIGLVSLGLAGAPAGAAPPGDEQRIVASDDDASDWFGRSVDVAGDFAVVGAPGDDEEGTNAGAAYVFARQGDSWVELQKLTAGDDAEQHDQFGFDVAIERDLIGVGAPNDDDAAGGGSDSGAVYLYEWNGAAFVLIEKLLPDDVHNAGHQFGYAVDIGIAVPATGTEELTNVVVGAPGADSFQGAVFLFQRNGALWTPSLGRFSDSDVGGGNDAGELGSSVAIRGDSFVAGAPLDDQNGNNVGAAYLFGRTNIVDIWNEVLPMYPSSPSPGDQFGHSVALSDNTVVVGAPAPSPSGTAGRVFVYDSGGPPAILTAGTAAEEFGSSVAVDEVMNLLVVGAKRDDEVAAKAGAVYLYRDDGTRAWQFGERLLASDAAINKEFGESVALGDGTLIVGGAEEDAFTPGAAYVYTSVIFRDHFESGGTGAWSVQVP